MTMQKAVSLLAIVPARMGSKGVPNKNKLLIAGRPLIEYTMLALEASCAVTQIIVTSDDPDILNWYGSRAGVLTIARPAELAGDESSTGDAVAHALKQWEAGGNILPEVILVAQPTTPLRTASDIDRSFDIFESRGRVPLISACRAEGIRHPRVMYRLSTGGYGSPYNNSAQDNEPRQRFEPVFQRNGAIYLTSTSFFQTMGRFHDATPLIYEMPWERSINIDGPGDFLIAKSLIESGILDG